jgi:hypothetical protein
MNLTPGEAVYCVKKLVQGRSENGSGASVQGAQGRITKEFGKKAPPRK